VTLLSRLVYRLRSRLVFEKYLVHIPAEILMILFSLSWRVPKWYLERGHCRLPPDP